MDLMMSTAENDTSSNEQVRTSQPTSILIRHQLSSNSIPINTQEMFSSLPPNSEMMPVAVLYDRSSPHQSFTSNIREVRVYTFWALFNLCFGCFILGIEALNVSCHTRRNKHHGNLVRAQDLSKITLLINTVATVSGLMIIMLVLLRYYGLIAM